MAVSSLCWSRCEALDRRAPLRWLPLPGAVLRRALVEAA